MKKSVLVLCCTTVALLLAALVTVALALQARPALPPAADLSLADIGRLHRVLNRHDPRRAWPGSVRTMRLSASEAELLLDHAARQLLHARIRLTLEAGVATVQTSVELPANPFGRWLNLQVRLRETDAWPVVDALRVGRLPLPAWLGERWKRQWVAQLDRRLQGVAALSMVRRVRMAPAELQLTYAWQDGSGRRVLAAWLPAPEQERVQHYAALLEALGAGLAGPQGGVPMVQWTLPLARLARERSAAGGDPALENRALILALASYVTGHELVLQPAPAAAAIVPRRRASLLLRGRVDTAQHFLVSAALAAEAGGPTSGVLGQYKELLDARGGSGFSFNDLAADGAGTRFGRLAVDAPARLQAALSAGIGDGDLLPEVSDLPESLTARQFAQDYGGVGGAGYQALMQRIDSRLEALPLYR